MVTAPGVRVLLDTGPTADEVADIRGWFARFGMTAECEGHSYGGPPPTSAFLIVVTSPLAPFLDQFAGTGGPGASLRGLVERLQALRSDAHRWGRPHGVKLEDSHSGHTVWLPPDLPAAAYDALVDVDVSGFDRDVPMVQLEWSPHLRCWQAALTTQPRRLARRAPRRVPGADNPRARELSERELGSLWQLAGHGDSPSVVTLQRARVVLWSTLGWNVASTAARTLMSEDRVRSVIRNFNTHGFASLRPDYTAGEPPLLTPDELHDATRLAAHPPSTYGLPEPMWTADLLAEYLVGEGVLEDTTPTLLTPLLPTPTPTPACPAYQ